MSILKSISGLASLLATTVFAAVAMASDDVASVLEADTAFAALSADRGPHNAFQDTLATDGILFRPTAVVGLEWLATHEEASGQLEWTPAAAAVSCTGWLAVTTGPWRYSSPDKADTVTGHYLSLWRPDSEGHWRLMLDHGIDHAATSAPSVALRSAFAALWPNTQSSGCPDARKSGSLADAEDRLDTAIRALGLDAALRGAAVDGALTYRDGAAPGLLAEANSTASAAFGVGSAAQPQLVTADPGANMGYSYGEISAGAATASPRAVFIRIWRRDTEGWRVAIDMLTALDADDGD